MFLTGRRRPAVVVLLAVGSLALMGARCQPTKPPPGGGGGTPPPPVTGGVFTAGLDGAQVTPPTVSSGTGTATVALDATETTITVALTFSGLTGTTINARIQGPAAIGVGPAPVVMTLTGFPSGVTAGTHVSPALPITAAQVGNLEAGLLYVVISTTTSPAGEVRGQLSAAP